MKGNLERELSSKIKHYEEQINSLKTNLAYEYETNLKKIKEEKESIESKYDSIKKSNRQLEQNNLILKNENEKDKAVFKEKQHNYERKIS